MSAPMRAAATDVVASLETVLGAAATVLSAAPVVLDSPGREVPLEARVTAPIVGDNLPVLLFSHGNGWSLDGYAPLASVWASHGFIVVQPTHLDSRRYGIGFDDPRFGSIWRTRHDDLVSITDQLGAIEASIPGLAGRMDRTSVVAAGHSWGAQTVQMLLGARVELEGGDLAASDRDERIVGGVLMAATGLAGDDLQEFARTHLPFMRPSFAELHAPVLVVAGSEDRSQLSSRGPDWFTDAFHHSPGATDLLTLQGAEHSLGGIPGYEAAETTDEDPERVAVLALLTAAYLRSVATGDAGVWEHVRSAFAALGHTIGRVDSK